MNTLERCILWFCFGWIIYEAYSKFKGGRR